MVVCGSTVWHVINNVTLVGAKVEAELLMVVILIVSLLLHLSFLLIYIYIKNMYDVPLWSEAPCQNRDAVMNGNVWGEDSSERFEPLPFCKIAEFIQSFPNI